MLLLGIQLRIMNNWLGKLQLNWTRRKAAPLPDDFIRRLRCSIPGEGMLPPGNVESMAYAIQQLPNEGAVLEIGSFAGLSTNVIAYLLQKNGKINPFFTCDAWIYEGYHDHIDAMKSPFMDGSSTIRRLDYMNYIKASFIHSTQLFSAKRLPFACHLRSDDFFHFWVKRSSVEDVYGRQTNLGGPIAFCYVDGDHAYATARRDADHVLDFLVPGGFLLLDDSADGQSFGSVQVAQELKKDTRLDLIAKNPHCLFQRK